MDNVSEGPVLGRPFVKHPCYTEAKTLSLKLAWSDQRFCFGHAREFLQASKSAAAAVLSALMDQRRVGRLTIRLSDPDHHKVLTHGTCGGSLSSDR
jgi:hypothetical protein